MSLRGISKGLSLALLLAAGLAVHAAAAAAACDSLLRPDESRVESDYTVLQAYMAQNADDEYERLKALDSRARSADANYRRFSVEYGESNSAEEFLRRVRTRLRDESFESRTSELRGLSRIYVSDRQMADWTKCESGSKSGALLLVASGPNAASFPIKVSFVPPAGVERADLVLSLGGAVIDNEPSMSDSYNGGAARSYVVKPTAGSQRVTIVANIAGLSDTLVVDLAPHLPTASITACDELMAVEQRAAEGAGAGLVPVAVKAQEPAGKRGRAWAYGCRQVKRVAALQAAAGTRADQRTTVSVCDEPTGMTYRYTSGYGNVLSPGSKSGAQAMQACGKISTREVLAASSQCADTASAMVCTGALRRLDALNGMLVPGAAKGAGNGYAVLCEGASLQKVCVAR